jgi:phosphoglycolate phosphatase
MTLKHIVFDCDGVLWDGTNEGYFRCYHGAAVEAGISIPYDLARERILQYWGQSAQLEVEKMIPEHPERVAEVVQNYRRLVRSDLFLSAARPIAGACDALAELARDYHLSVLTGMNSDNLAKLLDRFQLRALLRHTLSSGDTDDPAKQKATGYHLGGLLDQEGLRPAEALCVGDARCDVEMAQRRQVPIVVVLTGHLTEAQARPLGVAGILPSVTYLPGWIAQRRGEAV